MQSSIHASLKWQDGGTPVSKWTGHCIFSLHLEFTALQWIHMWVLHHHSAHVFDLSIIIVFVYLGLQVTWNQLSSNNSHHTSCIGVACWEVTWPNDLQTRFCQYTGIPLDRSHWKTTGATGTLGCHWNHTGWCKHPVVFQWRSSVNLHNWNTLEDHWSHRYTGMPLEPHWLMLAPSGIPVAIQC